MPKESDHSHKFLNQLSYHSLRIFKATFKYLPYWLIRPIVEGLMCIAYFNLRRQRKICQRNFRSFYGETKSDQEYELMTRTCIKTLGRDMIDMLYFGQRPKVLQNRVHIKGEERLKKELEKGKGVVAITGHIGNVPLMFASLIQRGYSVNVVIRPMRDTNFSKFMYEMCADWNVRLISTLPSKKFLKESLDALRNNELLFILFDEDVREGGITVDFLNTQVLRAEGPLLFHERAGSPIVPMFVVQDDNKDLQILIEESLKTMGSMKDQALKQKYVAQLTSVIERFVKQYPLQWAGWLNKKWGIAGN